MSELTWCPKCGRDLDPSDFEAGYCSGCGERLESREIEPESQSSSAEPSAVKGPSPDAPPEEVVWGKDGDWLVCPRCGASYDAADNPAYCERCVPDPEHPRLVYSLPHEDEAKAPVLTIIHEESGDELICEAGETILGRNSVPGLAGHMYVGRRHARISEKDGRFYLCDLDSVNGTKLNGKRLAPQTEAEIAPGDWFELDTDRFTVR